MGIEKLMDNVGTPQEHSKGREKREGKESFEHRFAEELRRPENGSYVKKMKRLMGAFVLAGLTVFGTAEKATSPELSEEYIAAERLAESKIDILGATKEISPELLKKVIASFQEKGGVPISPQLPETTFKGMEFVEYVRQYGRRGFVERPYFSRPEVILGEKFLNQNPEKAQEYLEKIEDGLRATVRIKTTKGSIGSGVIIPSIRGAVVLTNVHVVEDDNIVSVELINGRVTEGKVILKDNEQDLALLELRSPDIETVLTEAGAHSLPFDDRLPEVLRTTTQGTEGEKLAAIGHPFMFPWEVALCQFRAIEEAREGAESVIIYRPDERFTHLALYGMTSTKTAEEKEESKEPLKDEGYRGPYFEKGEALWGMSGGPVINLDRKGKARLSGLTTSALAYSVEFKEEMKKSGYLYGRAASAEALKQFLQQYETRQYETIVADEEDEEY